MDNTHTHYLHRLVDFQEVAIVSLEYAKRNYDCYCEDCRAQLEKAIEFGIEFVIIYGNHIIGVVL
ncbi:hypothetical protein J7K03_03325 [bacterium]|nr:hypothetical protein [bacterium]